MAIQELLAKFSISYQRYQFDLIRKHINVFKALEFTGEQLLTFLSLFHKDENIGALIAQSEGLIRHKVKAEVILEVIKKGYSQNQISKVLNKLIKNAESLQQGEKRQAEEALHVQPQKNKVARRAAALLASEMPVRQAHPIVDRVYSFFAKGAVSMASEEPAADDKSMAERYSSYNPETTCDDMYTSLLEI